MIVTRYEWKVQSSKSRKKVTKHLKSVLNDQAKKRVGMDLWKLPGGLCKLSQQDRKEIETDRKRFWKSFFQKIEDSYDPAGATEAIHEIDDPSKVDGRRDVVCQFPVVSKTIQRWIRDHEDYIDELTTIAGPPAEDEEDIGEEILEGEDEEEEENGNVEDDIEESFSQTEEESGDEEAMEEDEGQERIWCSSCQQATVYSPDVTQDEETFQCDVCLLGTHYTCQEECQLCRDIAAKVERRWELWGLDMASALRHCTTQLEGGL